MGGFSKNKAQVLAVHCVDTEGPIGGDVRRRPDGSKEFMDNWKDIKSSLSDITSDKFRFDARDSFGNYFILNWFIMDFMGFKSNPKNRIEKYNDTYDNIKSLRTDCDHFYWHYHQPPRSGMGDQWSDDWNSSDIHYQILGHRLIEREDFPEAFRAGGTIEDNKCSLWLEDNLMLDYSNRVSHTSAKTDDIFDFNWFYAPRHWGYYHPSRSDLFSPGRMRRYVVRSVDLRSRLHELQQWEVDEAFGYAKQNNCPIILSYFSHDHRDMRDETHYAIELIRNASRKFDVPFRWSGAKEAIQICEDIRPIEVKIGLERWSNNRLMITFRSQIFQSNPFVFTQKRNGDIVFHKLDLEICPACPYYLLRCFFKHEEDDVKIGIACTSMTGDKSILVEDL